MPHRAAGNRIAMMGVVVAALLSLTTIGIEAQQAQQAQPPMPNNAGIGVLPQTPLATDAKSTVPDPVAVPAKANSPISKSPTLFQLTGKLPNQQITLQDAMSIALSVNRAMALAAQALDRAQGRTSEARSSLGPTVVATPADVYLHDAVRLSAGVQASLPLDITGLIHAATDQAKFQEVGARLDVNRTRNQVIYDVQTAFYIALRAQALVLVAVDNLQDSFDRLHDAQVRYTAQTVAYFDVVRAQTDVANGQKQLIQARNAVSISIARLNSVLGIEVTTPLRTATTGALEEPPGVPPAPPSTPFGPAVPLPTAPLPVIPQADQSGVTARRVDTILEEASTLGPDFNRLLVEALKTRPELLEADYYIAAAQKGILIAQRSILPSLSVSVGYFDIRSSTGTPINEPEALVGLNVPLYDSGLFRARVQQARSDVASAITQKRQVTDLVTLDVEQAYLNLIQARDQVAVANQAVAQARTGYQLARVRYTAGVSTRTGVSPLLEVSDAQAALTLAEQNRVNALYDYNGARSQLDWSIGRFAYVNVGPGYRSPEAARR